MDEPSRTSACAGTAGTPPVRSRGPLAFAGRGLPAVPARVLSALLLLSLAAACGRDPEEDVRITLAPRTRLLTLRADARAAGVPPGVGSCADLASMPAAAAPRSAAALGAPAAFTEVASAFHSEVETPLRCVLTSRDEWLALRAWAGLDGDSAYSGPPAGAMLVVASLGERPQSGERIVIDSVWRAGDTLTVGVHRVGTGLGEMLTDPIVIVEVPALSRHVRFLEP